MPCVLCNHATIGDSLICERCKDHCSQRVGQFALVLSGSSLNVSKITRLCRLREDPVPRDMTVQTIHKWQNPESSSWSAEIVFKTAQDQSKLLDVVKAHGLAQTECILG